MILLDSDVMIDLLREYAPALTWLDSLENSDVLLPGYVVMELVQGCKSKIEQRRLQKELAVYETIWPTPEVCDDALDVFSRYYLSHNIGMIDALIGQLAVSVDATLCTFNQKHYVSIPGLKTLRPYDKRK